MNKWIRRMCNSLGYGVQSPSDFYFVQNVLREEFPYYAYSAIHKLHTSPDARFPRYSEPIDRLLFRLANHIHPSLIVEVGAGSSIFAMSMACPSARCIAITQSETCKKSLHPLISNHPQVEIKTFDEMELFCKNNDSIGLLHIAHTEQYKEVLEDALSHTTDNALIIIEDIRCDQAKQTWWKDLHENGQIGISYDLGNIGLLFLNQSRHKESYWVNLRR